MRSRFNRLHSTERKINPGSDLLFRALAGTVPSALVGLTTEFGMGSGVAPPEKPPGNL